MAAGKERWVRPAMDPVVESGAVGTERGRWRTAIMLSLAVILVPIFDPFALVLVPLGALMLGLPDGWRGRWVVLGTLLWVVALIAPGEGLLLLGRGWALMIGATYLGLTLLRPGWSVTTRGLATVAIAGAMGGSALLVTGSAGALDTMIREQFLEVGASVLRDLPPRMPQATLPADLPERVERTAETLADIFPALLAIQSLAALALASWWTRRSGRSIRQGLRLGRLRDFRFDDQMIWLLIGGLALVLLPLGGGVERVAWNLVAFMAALYTLRGFAVFAYLATGSRSVPTMVLGAIAFVFLYRVAITASLLMGVGDTWLDVRRRLNAPDST